MMIKEGKRICGLIKTNRDQDDPNSGVLVSTITANCLSEVLACSTFISDNQEETAVMLLATHGRTMFVATIIPVLYRAFLWPSPHPEESECSGWLDDSTKSVQMAENTANKTQKDCVTIKEISYANVSYDHDPEKLLDQVRTNAFSFLRRKGLYVDPPEEKEYNFDDLEL